MKKIAVKMLMLMLALAVSQVTLADSKDKKDKNGDKPATERRGFGYGRDKKGDRPQWDMQHPGKHRGFDQAKWDSIRAARRDAMQQKRDSLMAAHPNFKHKMDSLMAAHPDFKHKMDSLKAARPGFKHKKDSLKHGYGPKFHSAPMMGHGRRFHRHPHFGRPMFAHRPHGFHRPRTGQAEQTAEPEVKAVEIETTAITEVSNTQDAPTYDLQGRQVTGLQGKGIVVRNGKKYAK